MVVLKLPKEVKDQLIADVQGFFELERDEQVGRLAAEQVLDFMLNKLSPVIYNHAIADARRVIGEKMQAIEEDLYAMEQVMPRRK